MLKRHLLEKYEKIGIDFDDTLIDHPKSRFLWDYIEENPFNQSFHIVTFRSGGMETRIFEDLKVRGSRLEEIHFTAMHSVPHEMWESYHQRPMKLVASLTEIADDPYVLWKATTCMEQGIGVLIDDATHHVMPGCTKHGIAYFHPDDL